MNNYEINNNTIALIFNNYKTYVYEVDKELVINKKPNEIIKYSCEYFGSSLKGRIEGTKYITGITHKAPIIIEETKEIIFFPTSSPRLDTCCWIRNKYIIKYDKNEDNSCNIYLINGKKIKLNCSYEIVDNQIMRSSRLESIIRYRKNVNFV